MVNMKFENPPAYDISELIFKDEILIEEFFSKKYDDFFKSSNSRYLYWDELKHKKDLPFDPIKSWALLKLNRRSNYKKLTFGDSVFVIPLQN